MDTLKTYEAMKMWKQTRCAKHQEESTILPWNFSYTHNVPHDTQSCARFIIMLYIM